MNNLLTSIKIVGFSHVVRVITLKSYLVEWNEGNGNVKQNYLGLGKHYARFVKFDTCNRFLVDDDDFAIKFWNVDNK